MAIEEPDYAVVESYPDFELRRYEPYLVAETVVEGDFEQVGNRAFKILAGYIFGDNKPKQKIEMTAPVTQRPAASSDRADPEPRSGAGKGERIEMTAPVTQRPATASDDRVTSATQGSRHLLRFVMPKRFTLETLPEPTNPAVELRKVPSRLMAARRYSGRWTEANYQRNEQTLLSALRDAGIEPLGTPIYARYNSPFSLWPLRRNEVLVEVERSE